jgi:hypothetical protein
VLPFLDTIRDFLRAHRVDYSRRGRAGARTEWATEGGEVARWVDVLGGSTERNFVTFCTELFRGEQADEELDRSSLGEDCAKWLHSKLLAVEGVAPGVDPLEEDWGWTFGVRVHGVWF